MANNIETRVDVPTIVTAGRTFELALAEHRAEPTSPERLWNLQEAHWALNSWVMGLSPRDVAVQDCPYTKGQIRKFMGSGFRFIKGSNPDFAFFLPEVASTAEGLGLLGRAYPQMKSSVFQAGTPVKNIDPDGNKVSLHGWMRTESRIDAPYTGTTEDQARAIVGKNGRQGQTLNVCVEAGQQRKLQTGQYLDGMAWVRVLSSRVNGRVVVAGFAPDGHCYVDWSRGPGHVSDHLGVRSVV